MINNSKKLITYLETSINSIFKILPLFEEKNTGVHVYIESLLFELYGLNDSVSIEYAYEYISLLSNLESIKKELQKEVSEKTIIKREVFKCINIVKNMVSKLEEGE